MIELPSAAVPVPEVVRLVISLSTRLRFVTRFCASVLMALESRVTVRVTGSSVVADTVTSTPVSRPSNVLLPEVTVVAPGVSGHSVIEASDAARSCCEVSV